MPVLTGRAGRVFQGSRRSRRNADQHHRPHSIGRLRRRSQRRSKPLLRNIEQSFYALKVKLWVKNLMRAPAREKAMKSVLRGYAKGKDGNLILIGTMPVPHSKDKTSPRERKDKRHLVRQGATIFKRETVSKSLSFRGRKRTTCMA
jgi:hypothetical protein